MYAVFNKLVRTIQKLYIQIIKDYFFMQAVFYK